MPEAETVAEAEAEADADTDADIDPDTEGVFDAGLGKSAEGGRYAFGKACAALNGDELQSSCCEMTFGDPWVGPNIATWG